MLCTCNSLLAHLLFTACVGQDAGEGGLLSHGGHLAREEGTRKEREAEGGVREATTTGGRAVQSRERREQDGGVRETTHGVPRHHAAGQR